LNAEKKLEDLFDSTDTGLSVVNSKIRLDFNNRGFFVNGCKTIILNHLASTKKGSSDYYIGIIQCLKQPKSGTTVFAIFGSLNLDQK
jgi:hypothetical protein